MIEFKHLICFYQWVNMFLKLDMFLKVYDQVREVFVDRRMMGSTDWDFNNPFENKLQKYHHNYNYNYFNHRHNNFISHFEIFISEI
jgi:hypothetical protein